MQVHNLQLKIQSPAHKHSLILKGLRDHTTINTNVFLNPPVTIFRTEHRVSETVRFRPEVNKTLNEYVTQLIQ
jgi:hypothetical protein